MITIGKGKVEYSVEEARRVVAVYAFGQTGLVEWEKPKNFSFGSRPTTRDRWRYAYQSYDCVPASEGSIDMVDILVTTGLNSGVKAETMLAIHAVAPDISAELARLPAELTFWDLGEAEVLTPPTQHWRVWPMWRAWWLLVGVRGVRVAVAHKTLHHKRPRLFPLLDNQTVSYYHDGDAWAGIHRELATQAAEFSDLEAWFAERTVKRGGVQLSRLRLHDILLWCDKNNNRQSAGDLGRGLV